MPPSNHTNCYEISWVTKDVIEPRKKHSAGEIINKLREAEVLLAQVKKVPEVSRILGVTEQTYFRWSKEYGG